MEFITLSPSVKIVFDNVQDWFSEDTPFPSLQKETALSPKYTTRRTFTEAHLHATTGWHMRGLEMR